MTDVANIGSPSVEAGVSIDSGALEAGDLRAWDAIVDLFSEQVWSVARSHNLTGPPAAEVCRLTWMRLADHLGSIRADALGSWLVATAERESVRAVEFLSVGRVEGRLRAV